MTADRPIFPFSAIVGQERLRLALVLNAISPAIGGVLIRGERGSAKSTAVRALARLLPEIEVVEGCFYGCEPGSDDLCDECTQRPVPARPVLRRVPLVNLPVGATEERLLGSLNLERALADGERVFEPGLLAEANRGILYVDEVNLLADHLVDGLLDAAAMGRNYVEREGVSVSHPARFILVGTMNPEEGELRPQLLDRFALAVETDRIAGAEERVEVVRRRLAFESNPAAFLDAWRGIEEAERLRIITARANLAAVTLSDQLADSIARICADAQVDGLRADIAIYKTAVALAAYEGRTAATANDVRTAAELALRHRERRRPFDPPERGPSNLDQLLDQHLNEPEDSPQGADVEPPPPLERAPSRSDSGTADDRSGPDRTSAIGERFAVRPVLFDGPRVSQAPRAGRRTTVTGIVPRGRTIGARIPTNPLQSMGSLALAPTVLAAAPMQALRRSAVGEGRQLRIVSADHREKVRESRAGALILFAVDGSGSMGARERMVAVKGAVLSLLTDAYQRRDQVAMVTFRGLSAQLVLPPTNSVDLAADRLRDLPTGGRTPLGHALGLCEAAIRRQQASAPERPVMLVIISDGRPNVAISAGLDPQTEACRIAAGIRGRGVHSLVIDTETGPVRTNFNRRLASALGGECLKLEELAAGSLAAVVTGRSR